VDNGYYNPGDAETYALLNRRNLTWYYPEIVQALMRGAGVDPLVSPTPTPTIMPTPSPTVTANILYGDVTGTEG